MITGSRGDDHQGQILLAQDVRDDGLRPVPAGHTDDVGTIGKYLPGKVAQVDPRAERVTLDAAGRGLLNEPEPLRLTIPGQRIDQQNWFRRRCDDLARRRGYLMQGAPVAAQRVAAQGQRDGDADAPEDDGPTLIVGPDRRDEGHRK